MGEKWANAEAKQSRMERSEMERIITWGILQKA